MQVKPTQVFPNFRSLFDVDMPTGLRCLGVLNGDLGGRIFTDDPLRPTWGVVQEAYDGTIYLGGAINTSLLHQLINNLCTEGQVVLGLWFDDTRLEIPSLNPEYDGAAIDFTNRPIGQGLESLLRPIPDGYELQRVDEQLFVRCAEYEQSVAALGGPEKALEKLIGFCLMDGNEIVCEAFAGVAIMGVREMGVATHKAYRQRGFATLTCAHLIHTCEQMGYQTYWNCARQNLASAALARKLGYRTEQEYRVLAWFQKPANSV